MYRIYADDDLIYDSTSDDYKIGKGSITLELNKSGSFTFSLYPDHPHYDSFIRLRTVITVYKGNRIVFRGRILNDVTDYWNNKVFTCEGELGFLQDSIVRPFKFKGSPQEFFRQWINNHNAQVDEFKRFKIGNITVVDPNDYINRSSTLYQTTFDSMSDRLTENAGLGGYFYITHGDDGTDPIPTINYLVDFTKVSTQTIEFGSNLKDYTKTIKGEDIATAIIPLGATLDDGDENTSDPRLTIADVNNGIDYVYDADAVALYGWIFKTETWEDVTVATNLKKKAEDYLKTAISQNITIELKAIDLHLLDKSIESFKLGDYIKVISEPHNFDSTLLCNKQTIDLLKPENDTLVLGYSYSTFTDSTRKISNSIQTVTQISSDVNKLSSDLSSVKNEVNTTTENVTNLQNSTGLYGVSDSVNIPVTSTSVVSVAFGTPFSKVPSAVVITPFSSGALATVTINAVTTTGFEATIKNSGTIAADFKLYYVAYP